MSDTSDDFELFKLTTNYDCLVDVSKNQLWRKCLFNLWKTDLWKCWKRSWKEQKTPLSLFDFNTKYTLTGEK